MRRHSCKLALSSAHALALALVAGCAFDRAGIDGDGPDPEDDATSGGGAPGDPDAAAPGDAADAGLPPAACAEDEVALPFEPSHIDRCVPSPERGWEIAAGETWRIDTQAETIEDESGPSVPTTLEATRVLQPQDGPEILLVVFDELRVEEGARLYAAGPRALAIAVAGSIEIESEAVISVGAGDGSPLPGPGGDGFWCDEGGFGEDGEAQEYGGDDGGSGGGGGGFGAAGGAGAPVNESGGEPASGGGPVAPALGPEGSLRGGCSGGDGYRVETDGNSSLGGGAGGALALAAGESIAGDGAVSASGGGGFGGKSHSGGGGGGSGGALVIEAQTQEFEGAVTANGGGGGLGSRADLGNCPTEDGEDGARASDEPAEGGSSSCGPAGPGGAGGARETPAGEDGAEGDSSASGGGGPGPAGGGGGGGGVGRIIIRACELEASPAIASPQNESETIRCGS